MGRHDHPLNCSALENSPDMWVQLCCWRQNEGVFGRGPGSSHAHPVEIKGEQCGKVRDASTLLIESVLSVRIKALVHTWQKKTLIAVMQWHSTESCACRFSFQPNTAAADFTDYFFVLFCFVSQWIRFLLHIVYHLVFSYPCLSNVTQLCQCVNVCRKCSAAFIGICIN